MMRYLIYKTTNLLNNKIYIGVHSQLDESFDGYLGSGDAIKSAVIKYGSENFIRETLYSYGIESDAYLKEKELINEDFINDRTNYNLTLGGSGNSYKLNSEESINKRTKTYIERGYADCKHMITEEAKLKAKNTRKLNGTDQCTWMNNPEVQKRAVENSRKSVINNSLKKYPILNSQVEFIDIDGTLILDGSLYDISVFINGKGRAVSYHNTLVRILNKSVPFKMGPNKGRSIKFKESSTTSPLDVDSSESKREAS